MLWPKKNLFNEFDNEKKFPWLENSPSPPKTFLMVRPLAPCALQDAGGNAISRQNNRLAFGSLYLLIELFYTGMSVVQTDGRAYGHVVTKFSRMGRLPHFLYPWCSAAPASRARAPVLYFSYKVS